MSQTLEKTESTTIVKVKPTEAATGSNLKKYVEQNMGALQQVAARNLTPERISRILVASVSKTPALQKCSVLSIYRSALQAAELGLEPGGALGHAYLVPFKDQCTLIVGYRGLIELAYRSGQISSVRANVVYQGDRFEYEEGLTPKLLHVPQFDAPRDKAKITFAYCIVKLKDGGTVYDVMTRGEVDAIRNRSRSGNSGPWVTDYAEMVKKTVARRCLKYAPMSVEMQKAFATDADDHEGYGNVGSEVFDAQIVEDESAPSETDKLMDRIGEDDGYRSEDEPAEQESLL
jgi:recombination protein RecT